MKLIKCLIILFIVAAVINVKVNSSASMYMGSFYLDTPTASLTSGVYFQYQWVSLYAESGSVIRYTLDGTEPNEYSLVYSGPIAIYSNTTIKAKAFKYGCGSPTFTGVYAIANNQSYGDLLVQAQNLYNQGQYNQAIEQINQLLYSNAGNEPALILLLDCYAAKEDFYDAETKFSQTMAFYEYPRVVNRYAELCIDNFKYEDARKAIEDILPNYPGEIYLYNTLARAYKNFYAEGIKVFVYGNEIDFTQYDYVYPVIVDGRTLIPIRALSESLGALVDWDYNQRKASIYLDNKVIEITTDSPATKVDGKTRWLDVPARITDDRLMVPLRFISENFGREVNWFTYGENGSIISVN